MTRSTETRTSAPHPTADSSITAELEADPPASVSGRTVDASSVPSEEDVAVRMDVELASSQIGSAMAGASPARGRLAVSLRCNSTRWSDLHEVDRIALPPAEDQKRYRAVSIVIPRRDVERRVDGQVVVLAAARDKLFRPGAVIAQWPFKVQLKRQGREFPTKWISFSGEDLPRDALWHLDLSSGSWHREASSAATILLNEDVEAFRSLFPEDGSGLSAEAKVMAGQISYDCIATLLQLYLTDAELQTDADPDGDRLIDKLEATLQRLFTEKERRRLPDAASEAPTKLRTQLQAKMRNSLL